MPQFLKNYLTQLNIPFQCDKHDNILAFVKGDVDKSICLQAHYDMVFVTDSGKKSDEIELYEDNGFLKAKGTSLGADNCATLACILALVQNHKFTNSIELLFTSDEETNLTGATNLELPIRSKYHVNTDCEEIGTIIVGSAGGMLAEASFTLQPTATMKFIWRVELSGFTGGHTGFDIHKNRCSIVRLMLFLLQQIGESAIHETHIGTVFNSIAFSGYCVISTNKEIDIEQMQHVFGQYMQSYSQTDPNGKLRLIPEQTTSQGYSLHQRVFCMMASPQGQVFHEPGSGVVDTTSNMSVLKFSDGKLVFQLYLRSLREFGMDYINGILESFICALGAEYSTFSRFPAWEIDHNNVLERLAAEIYERTLGRKCVVKPVMAGYETSVLLKKCPAGTKAISIGPEIHNPHSVHEELNIESMETFYNVMKELIEKFGDLE